MADSTIQMPDGLSFETALFVDSVEEEYEWLDIKFPGFQLIEQSVQHFKGRTFDVLDVELPAGSSAKVFFDITDFCGDAPYLFPEVGS